MAHDLDHDPDKEAKRPGARRVKGGGIGAEGRRRIARGLRTHYARLLAEPLPERFEALLAELGRRSKPEEPSQ